MKRFGFHPEQLYFHQRNPLKVRYLKSKKFGEFEAPMKPKNRDLTSLVSNYQQRLDFEKYMNPKGLKPTITSRFKKPQQEIEFVSHSVMLHRSPRPYDENTVCFRVDPFLSRPELKQYLTKLYKLPIQDMKTVNKMGKIMTNYTNRRQWRKKDWKKAICKVDYEVDPEYQKLL